jgi:uncharacterized damage-inducible protein DinB
MHAEDIQLLYDYNCWANARILRAAAGVPGEQFASARLSYCGLRDTLVHMFSAERRWRARWQGEPNRPMLVAELVPTLDVLRELWEAEQPLMRAYLATVSDDELASVFLYQRPNGTLISSTRWHTMAHMINHATQHRAELGLLLTELGCSPGNLDMNVFLSRDRSYV